MIRTKILQLFFACLAGLLVTTSPGLAFDPAQGARDSIIQSVRDDVRRKIRLREEQRFRDSRAEFRRGSGEASRRKIHVR
jgi:hypothetical protein